MKFLGNFSITIFDIQWMFINCSRSQNLIFFSYFLVQVDQRPNRRCNWQVQIHFFNKSKNRPLCWTTTQGEQSEFRKMMNRIRYLKYENNSQILSKSKMPDNLPTNVPFLFIYFSHLLVLCTYLLISQHHQNHKLRWYHSYFSPS